MLYNSSNKLLLINIISLHYQTQQFEEWATSPFSLNPQCLGLCPACIKKIIVSRRKEKIG